MFEHSFSFDATISFERPYGWEELFSFWHLFSWDYFLVIFFDAIVEFLGDGFMRLSSVKCLHGLTIVEVFHVVACGKRYEI